MAVRFVTGRNGADRTDKLLELCFFEAKSDDTKPIFILVPEKYTYEMEKKLSEKLEDNNNTDSNFRIRVVSFSTLSKIVFTTVGGLKDRKLTQSARGMLVLKAIYSVSKDLITLKTDDLKMGFINKVRDMIVEFKQNEISFEDVFENIKNLDNESLRYKLEDFAKMYKSYENLICNKYFDTEDVLSVFAKKLDFFEEINGATVFVDEYMDFTVSQYLVIEKLLCLSKNIYFSLFTDLKNMNSKLNVFNRSNSTFLKIRDLCLKNNVEIKPSINLDNSKFYAFDDLAYLEKNINNFSCKKYVGNCDNVKIFSFRNSYFEIEHIANEILKLIKDGNYRYSDIALCMRDFGQYSHIIERVFDDYNIGYFLDKKIEVSNNPIIILILSILDMKFNNYSYMSVFRYLKSGLTGISDDDIFTLENYVIKNGIRGNKWFEESFEYSISHKLSFDDEDKELLETVNEIKKKVISPIFDLHNKLKGRNTVSEICRFIYEFVLDIDLPQRIDNLIENFKNEGNLYKAKEYSQVWGIFISVLDELVEFIGDEKISLEKFMNLISVEFENMEIGIVPPSKDEVFVTSVDRMKKPNVKILFVVGVNEGVFPKNFVEDGLISENEKEKLLNFGFKFDKDSLSKNCDEEFFIYKSLTTPTDRLYLTFPLSDLDGKSMRASKIIKRIRNIFDIEIENFADENSLNLSEISNIFSKEKLYEILLKNIVQENFESLSECEKNNVSQIYKFLINDDFYKKRILNIENSLQYKTEAENINDYALELYNSGNFSVSKLERFASCPFSYFMIYGLKLKERELYEFTPVDYGTYCHKVLDEFFKNIVKNNVDWDRIDDNYINVEVKNITKKILENNRYILKSSKRYEYLAGTVNENLSDSINVMAEQVRRGNFLPYGFETSFGFDEEISPINYKLENGKEINLTGKIDRIDMFKFNDTSYLRIIDYKSSRKSLDLNKVYAGIQLQIFVYMNALLNHNKNFKPAGLLYSNLTNNVCNVESFSELKNLNTTDMRREILKNNKLSGIVIKDLELINNLDFTLNSDNHISEILPITLKNKGMDIGSNTSGLTQDEFEIVDKFVLKKSKSICEDIYKGNISVRPYKYDEIKACDFCKYKSVCKFDPKKHKYNSVKKFTYRNDYTKVLDFMKTENEKE